MDYLKWKSGERDGTLRSNLLHTTVLKHFLSVSSLGIIAINDCLEMIRDRRSPCLHRLQMRVLLYSFVIPLVVTFKLFVIVLEFLNLLDHIVEEVLGFVISVATMGLVVPLHQRWCYQTFIELLEFGFGSTFHRSTIKILVPPAKCTCGKSKCKQGECYKVTRRWLVSKELTIRCSCYRKYVEQVMRLARNRGEPFMVHSAEGKFYEEVQFTVKSLTTRLKNLDCGSFDDQIIVPYYDIDRLRWIEAVLKTGKHDGDHFYRSRSNQEETLVIETDPSGLDDVLRLETSMISMTQSLMTSNTQSHSHGANLQLKLRNVTAAKLATILGAVIVAVIAVVKETKPGRIAGTVILLVTATGLINLISDSTSLARNEHVTKGQIRATLINAVSSGIKLEVVAGTGTCWSRWSPRGLIPVAPLNWAENAVYNRSAVFKDRVMSLSRKGKGVQFGELSSKVAEDGNLHVEKWMEVEPEGVDELLVGQGPPRTFPDQKIGGTDVCRHSLE